MNTVKEKISFLMIPLLLLFFLCTFIIALDFNSLAKYFLLFLSGGGLLLCLIKLIIDVAYFVKHKHFERFEEAFGDIKITHEFKTAAANFLWIILYLVLIFIFGFI